MKIVKLTAPWDHDFYAQTPEGKGIYGDYKFEINNDCDDADFWIVYGGLRIDTENKSVKCPKENIIYLTDECFDERAFVQPFLDQFEKVITPRTDLQHKNIIHHHEINTWTIKKSYDELKKELPLEKTKMLSIVVSNRTDLPGHKDRFAFVNKLMGHFKDKLDVYGMGFNPIYDKFDALKDYKYSIAIENSTIKNYFTEKIYDCYLSETMPIYWGCPNITDFFHPDSFSPIDIYDFNRSVATIEELLATDPFASKHELIRIQKFNYLAKSHLFPCLTSILDQLPVQTIKTTNQLKMEIRFERGHQLKRLVNKLNEFIPAKYQFDLTFRNQNYSNK